MLSLPCDVERRSPLRCRALRPLVALVLLAAACGGGGDGDDGAAPTTPPPTTGRTLTATDLSRITFQPSDLPSGYTRDDATSGERAATRCFEGAPSETVSHIQSFGLQTCYSSNYTKKAGSATNNAGSGALLFRDAQGASQALPVLRTALLGSFEATGEGEEGAIRDLPASGLGDERPPGAQATVEAAAIEFDIILYVWRNGNVVAFLGGSDVLGDMDASRLLDVARKVDGRVA